MSTKVFQSTHQQASDQKNSLMDIFNYKLFYFFISYYTYAQNFLVQ